MRRVVIALLLLALALAALVRLLPQPAQRAQPPADVADYLGGGEANGFTRVWGPQTFEFPADHGPHTQYKTEWWYYTGNLETAQGRHFGYQLTLFRIGMALARAHRASAWGANQVYMAHFTVTDVQAEAFHSFERFSRAAIGLAGAQAEPFRVWLEDWSAASVGRPFLPLRLSAQAGDIAIDLTLNSLKPLILQGDRGYSQKSAVAGNASYYYSYTRMPTIGNISVGAKTYPVRGLSWMDREWSTSALAADQAGWDWFSLQLDTGQELMYYQLRRKDGRIDPASSGTWVLGDGTSQRLDATDVTVEVLDRWRSPKSGVGYPSGWRIRISDIALDVTVTPYIKDQELNVSVRYWEGAVKIGGTLGGKPVAGSGYTELAGYSMAR